MIKKILCFAVALIVICPLLASCAKEQGTVHMLSFSQTQSISDMEKLDGKQVSIIGYMSTMSPVSGQFMYLMNLPYQNCPFCVPNTTQLSNTMAVYAKDTKGFEFTDRAIQVTGTLEFGEYTDEFGYKYNYRIKDATYSILDTTDMSEELRLWQQLASTSVLTDIYTMFEYVSFLCSWPVYTASFSEGRDYLYPADALMFVEQDGAQFNYGFKEGYFDNIISTVKRVDETAFAELVDIVERAEALADKAYVELKNGAYIQVSEYGGEFNDGRAQYKLNISTELETEMSSVYTSFSEWLLGWEI